MNLSSLLIIEGDARVLEHVYLFGDVDAGQDTALLVAFLECPFFLCNLLNPFQWKTSAIENSEERAAGKTSVSILGQSLDR